MNKPNRPNGSFYVMLCLAIIAIAYVIISKAQLKKHGILLNARTMNWASGAKMSITLKYEFYYKGKRITGANSFKQLSGITEFEERYFPVMYYPELGGHSQLLIRPNDFKEFNIPFPDSLRWVLKYMEK